MTTKEKFKAYYLPWLIGLGILFGIQFAIGYFNEEQHERVTSVRGIALLVGLVVGSALLCGGIYHWFFEVYRPNRLVKLFNKLKKLDLQEVGLAADEETRNFKGYHKGYYLTIFVDSSLDEGENVRTNAFFIPRITQEDLYKRLQKKFELSTDNDLYWFTCKTKMKFGRSPKQEKLKADINDLVDALRYESIEPLVVTD